MNVEPLQLRLARDARGVVFEPLGPAELASQRNVHVVLTQPGEVRGNHVHRHGTEVCAVIGPALVRLRDCRGLRDYEVPEGVAWRFEFAPGVAHAIRHSGPWPGIIISFNTRAHDPGDPDTERDILIPPGSGAPTVG